MASVAAPRALDEDDLPLAAERPGGNPHGSEADGLNPGDLDPAIPGAYLAPSASHSRALHGSGAPRPFESSTGRQAEQAEHAELTDRFAAFVAENGGTHDVSVAALEPAGSDPSTASLGPGRQAVAASAVTPATTPLQTAASGAGAAGAAVAAESRRWFSSPAPATTNEPARELITLRAPVDLAGWAVAVGGFLAALAFALPWAKNGVAGAGL
ncbi:MAG TPA: hypothetical protein VE817_02310, partial [Candidatus Acidoferrum sp.]|nr:hypothetical protein [Candidatus Acidoferrum sp.]